MSKTQVSRSDFAKIMGVDRSQVTRWIERGMPSFEDATVDPVFCADWVRRNIASYALRRSRGAGQLQAAERSRWVGRLASLMGADIECATETATMLLLPVLPEPVAREIVTQLARTLLTEAVAYLEEEFDPPPGCAGWREAPQFKWALPNDKFWAGLLDQSARQVGRGA